MAFIITEELLHYNRLGIVPGPLETLEEFVKRARYCLDLKQSFETKLAREAPFSHQNRASDGVIKEAFPTTELLYDIQPDWIPLFFSNYKLSFWHGGCAWIFQENDETPMAAFFQLRKTFQTKPSYLGLYKRDKLIAHELSHVGRMMFEEIRFEEVLSYRSDSSRFRRYFGPIMQSSWESALFVILLFLILMVDLSMVNVLSESAYRNMMWWKLVPIGMILYALGRLIRRQGQFSRCLKKLKNICQNTPKANAVIYRLTDEEICRFAQFSPAKILEYAKQQKEETLRWAIIFEAYLPKSSYSVE